MARRWAWGRLDTATKLPDLVAALNERMKNLEGSFNFGTALTLQAPTAATTAVTLDDVLAVNATSAPVAITLPSARAGKGHTLVVVKTDASANAVTVTPVAGDTVCAAATWVLSGRNEGVMLVGDGGTNWLPIADGAVAGSRISGAINIGASALTCGALSATTGTFSGAVLSTGANTVANAFRMWVTGDTQYRCFMTAAGKFLWSDGSAAADVSLERTGANALTFVANVTVGALTATSLTVGANQVVGARGLTVADPSGGGVQDAEARTAIGAIIDRLQAHGLIA